MPQTNETLRESIARQRRELLHVLQEPLQQLAQRCAQVWPHREKLEQVLGEGWPTLPYGKSLYALDTNGIQISSNVTRNGLLAASFGRDRSKRPYLSEAMPISGALLSEAYISQIGRHPSLTAVQVVRATAGAVLGFIGIDFGLRELPLTHKLYDEPVYWRQLKGDPSIRNTVFHQNRAESMLDQQIDVVLGVIEELMAYHGVYHVILHFSSNRAVIWEMGDPYRYRMLDIDALIDPDICLAFPKTPYPADALVPQEKIRAVLDAFRKLRYMDEMFYLRSGTLNLFNGIVGLTFSCDGSHYIPYDEFLNAGHDFWVGHD
ncbi:MAG: PDC sensor domain-containing protein [Sideroxydans sp.]|nr:PDC sensor domain-containing protein [Sideroxydans sp.]